MTDERPSDVLGSLPHTRPHRRSSKRPAQPKPVSGKPAGAPTKVANGKATPAPAKAQSGKKSTGQRGHASPRKRPARLRQPAQPAGTPPGSRPSKPLPSGSPDVLATAVQAAAELAEMGLSAGARAIRGAVSRLPRP